MDLHFAPGVCLRVKLDMSCPQGHGLDCNKGVIRETFQWPIIMIMRLFQSSREVSGSQFWVQNASIVLRFGRWPSKNICQRARAEAFANIQIQITWPRFLWNFTTGMLTHKILKRSLAKLGSWSAVIIDCADLHGTFVWQCRGTGGSFKAAFGTLM